MKKSVLIVLFTFLSFFAFSQTTENPVVGQWSAPKLEFTKYYLVIDDSEITYIDKKDKEQHATYSYQLDNEMKKMRLSAERENTISDETILSNSFFNQIYKYGEIPFSREKDKLCIFLTNSKGEIEKTDFISTADKEKFNSNLKKGAGALARIGLSLVVDSKVMTNDDQALIDDIYKTTKKLK